MLNLSWHDMTWPFWTDQCSHKTFCLQLLVLFLSLSHICSYFCVRGHGVESANWFQKSVSLVHSCAIIEIRKMIAFFTRLIFIAFFCKLHICILFVFRVWFFSEPSCKCFAVQQLTRVLELPNTTLSLWVSSDFLACKTFAFLPGCLAAFVPTKVVAGHLLKY